MNRIIQWWHDFRGQKARAALKQAQVDLAEAHLEIKDLQVRLQNERQSLEKSKRNIQTMWNFIALRHRLDLPVQPGSIKEMLQKAERQ